MKLSPVVQRGSLVASIGLALIGPGIAHEDDPKLLDRKPSFQGAGFLSGAPGSVLHPQLRGGGSNGVFLESVLSFADLGLGSDDGNDCWGYVSPSGREYALMCTRDATVFVEVTNPALPVVLGRINGNNSTWRDVKTYQDRAYIVTEASGGIQVVDLSDIDNGNFTLENTITGPGTDNSHNVAIDTDSGFLYRCGGGGNGLRIYDLSNPSTPTYVGEWQDRYVHDVQVVTYMSGPLAGREIAYCCAGLNGGGTDTGLTVVDVTNKAAPVVLDQIAYPNRAYSHQGWLSEDRTLFYLGDELDEGNGVAVTTTHVFDVVDPNNVSYIGQFDNGSGAIGHNMYTHDGLLFQANYTSGLRVFDVTANPTNPAEVAFYDTNASTNATFNGLWSCYPYFPSGTIIGSDIQNGLYIWTMDEPELEISLPNGAPNLIAPGGDDVDVQIVELVPGTLDPATPMLVYDNGGGATSVGLTANGGTSYTASFPSQMCGAAVSWYVTVSSTTGASYSAPGDAPAGQFTSIVADTQIVTIDNNMETMAGWTGGAPGDTATTGIWERGDPNGTAAQPEDDNSAIGAQCWFTGQAAPGAGIGSNDVDGGHTTLLTNVMDLTGMAEPSISYYRWYSNDQGGSANADVFDVEISSNGGTSWTLVERVGPSGPGTGGGWIQHEFRVGDFITPTSTVQMRFIAEDIGGGSIVEAAIDDFRVFELDCGDGIGTQYCDANPNSTGQIGEIVGLGSIDLAMNNLVLTAMNLPTNSSGYFITSTTQTFVANAGNSEGNLCVGGSIGRYVGQIGNSGAMGQLQVVVDNTMMPGPMGFTAAAVGQTWNFQCWHRDMSLFPTSNFTRGYSITYQ